MKIEHINYSAFEKSKNRKMKLCRERLASILAAALVLASTVAVGTTLVNASNQTSDVQYIQVDRLGDNVLTYIDIKVNPGETLEEIATRYYSDEVVSAYGSIRNFEGAIAKENDMQSRNIVYSGQNLRIPVVVSKDNMYYMQVVAAEQQINNFPKEILWVDHTVELGDNLYSLAALSCIDGDDIISTVAEIKKQNNLTSSNIMLGTTIKIKNPALKELKQDLYNAQEAFAESLTPTEKGFN